MLTTLNLPGVYEIIQDPVSKQIIPIYKSHKFDTPEKLYGEIKDYVNVIWKSFKRNNYKGGVILTGLMGSGKTEIGKVLSNKAIDEGMSVYLIKNIKDVDMLISILDNLDNAVLFFDEFGKNFPMEAQEKMLTILSNPTGKRRLTIITENESFRISRFIRNRPGRIRYALNFDKLPKSVVIDYCKDKNVSLEFLKEILEIYPISTDFTFDHLKALVEEHLNNPDIPTEILFKVLNIDFLKTTKYLKLKKATFKGKDITSCIDAEVMPYSRLLELDIAITIKGDCKVFEKDEKLWSSLLNEIFNMPAEAAGPKETFSRSVWFTKNDIRKSDENEVVVKYKDFEITFELFEKNRLREDY